MMCEERLKKLISFSLKKTTLKGLLNSSLQLSVGICTEAGARFSLVVHRESQRVQTAQGEILIKCRK